MGRGFESLQARHKVKGIEVFRNLKLPPLFYFQALAAVLGQFENDNTVNQLPVVYVQVSNVSIEASF